MKFEITEEQINAIIAILESLKEVKPNYDAMPTDYGTAEEPGTI